MTPQQPQQQRPWYQSDSRANQNPDQYDSMMNGANMINKFASSSPFKGHLTSIKQDGEKTGLAHYGLHKLASGSTTVDRIIDPLTPGKYNRFLAPLAAAKYNNITAPLASAAADAGLSFIYGLTAPINTAKALPQLITSPELRFVNRGASIVGSLAGMGTLGYGAYRAGKALMRQLQPVEQDAEKTVLAHYGLHKLASGPESSAVQEEQAKNEKTLKRLRAAHQGLSFLGAAALLSPYAREGLTGRAKLYHGTAAHLVPQIVQEGLKPQSEIKGPSITAVTTPAGVRAASEPLTFLTRLKSEARTYGAQSDLLHKHPKLFDSLRGLEAIQSLVDFSRPVVEADIPLWRPEFSARIRRNPETEKSFMDFMRKRTDTPFIERLMHYPGLASATVLEGGVSPEYIRGSEKYIPHSFGEFKEYVRTHPGRFAKGLGLGLGVLGLSGYGLKKLYEAARPPAGDVQNSSEQIKTSSGPESNVHRDVGAYRFNRAAESNDIDDSRQYVFKAHDRRPQVTGDESGQGITFQEGVSG